MSRSVLIGRSVKQAGPLVPQIAERQITGIYQALLKIEKVPMPADMEERLSGAQADRRHQRQCRRSPGGDHAQAFHPSAGRR